MQSDRKAQFARQLSKAGWADTEIKAALKNAKFSNEVSPDPRYLDAPSTLAELMGIPHVPEATAAKLFVDGVDLGDSAKVSAQERHDAALRATKQSRGGRESGEKRRDAANHAQDTINRLTAELRRKHPKASRPELLDRLLVAVAGAGISYSRSTLARLMPPKSRR